MKFDVRYHPRSAQLGFTKSKTRVGPQHMDIPSEWNEHLLMLHFLVFTIDIEWNTYPL